MLPRKEEEERKEKGKCVTCSRCSTDIGKRNLRFLLSFAITNLLLVLAFLTNYSY
jgi:hypothetical protein